MSAERAPCFIVGMPRAATTWMCKCLNEHPDACAFGETLFWGRQYVRPGHGGEHTPEEIERIEQRLASGHCVREMAGVGPGSLRHVTPECFGALLRDAWGPLRRGAAPGELFAALCRSVADAEGKRLAVEKTPHHLNWIDRISEALPGARFVVMVREPYGFMLLIAITWLLPGVFGTYLSLTVWPIFSLFTGVR